MRAQAFAFLTFCFLPAPGPGAKAACGEAALQNARAVSVSDALDVSLDNGLELRLSGIDTVSGGRAALLAALREGLPPGAAVQFTAGEARDRWGRAAAQLYLPPERPGLPPDWVQGVLVAKGLARIWPEAERNPCWKELAATETAARQERRGLWAAGDTAEWIGDKDKVLAAAGARGVFRGRVTGIGQGRASYFINFGRAQAGIPSLRVPKRLQHDLKQAGIELEQLRGRMIRIRGIATAGSQTYVAVSQAEQIELE